jgi:glycerol kinase
MKVVASIDQGTTSTRCIFFDKKGQIISMAQKEHKQIFPQAGWVEHNPVEIAKNTLEVIAQARIEKSISISQVQACGITNQRETTVIWNSRTGKPYYNAIVWQDTRVAKRAEELEEKIGSEYFRNKTGLPITTYFSSLKIQWLLENVEGLREDAERGLALFGNMDTYTVWNLTKGELHITDVTNASRTQLMNLETLQWDTEILEKLNIPASLLPEIRPSSQAYGKITAEPLAGIPLSGILGDQQSALVGQTCFQPGEAKNTYGTGCFMLLNTGEKPIPSKHGLLTTVAYQFENQPVHYALEGSVAVTGSLVQWLRDNLGIIKKSTDIEALAQTVEDNGDTYFVPAFSGLYAPYWESSARGVIAGLTRFVNKGHIARAALEATAYQTLDVLQAMEKDAGIELKSLKVDGGMVVNELLMQFQTDMIKVPVIRPTMIETTALGAAYAAGLAVGFWEGIEDLKANWGKDKEWTPKMDEEQRSKYSNGWKKAVEKARNWVD